MGCRFEILIDARCAGHDRSSCAAIARELGELIVDWHNRLTIFHPHSLASRINRQPAGVPLRIDLDMFELCALCERLRVRTHGAFNIASGTLMHAHGFRGDRSPIDTAGLDLGQAIGLDESHLTITRNDPRIALDFGAIAKGFVLDLLGAELGGHGVANAFFHGGASSVLARGLDANDHAWSVRAGGHDFRLGELALGVSEHESRVVDRAGQTLGHIMDPRTHAPCRNAVSLVTCAHASAAVADAYSTALSADPSLAPLLADDACSMLIRESEHATMLDPLGVITRPAHDKDRP